MTPHFRFLRALASVALIAVPLAVGCTGNEADTFPVSGKVTYRNKPVAGGTIMFIPADDQGPTATGELQPDGSYSLTTYRAGDGAVRGKHKVVVIAMEDTSTQLPEDRSPTPPPTVPIKYTSAGTTDLSADVKEQPNTIDFPLKDGS